MNHLCIHHRIYLAKNSALCLQCPMGPSDATEDELIQNGKSLLKSCNFKSKRKLFFVV